MLTLIATWKLLVKSGEKGWKALIPFYNDYVLYKQFYDKRLFWNILIGYAVTLVLAIVASIVAVNNPYCMYCAYNMSPVYCYNCCASIGFWGVLAIVMGVVTVVCHFVFSEMLLWYTGKAFDAKSIHCLCMMFLPIPSIILLGFDEKFVYTGNKRPFCIPKKQKEPEI